MGVSIEAVDKQKADASNAPTKPVTAANVADQPVAKQTIPKVPKKPPTLKANSMNSTPNGTIFWPRLKVVKVNLKMLSVKHKLSMLKLSEPFIIFGLNNLTHIYIYIYPTWNPTWNPTRDLT